MKHGCVFDVRPPTMRGGSGGIRGRFLGTLASVGIVLAGMNPPALAAPRLAVAPGDKAPGLAADALGSDTQTRVRWEDASLTVVNFWATWCAPCRSEMPALESLRQLHADRGLVVYGVLLDPAEDVVVARFIAEVGVTYPVLRGSVNLSDQWGGIGLMPTTFLVDAQGIVRRRYVGATEETVARMRSDVAQFFESTTPAPVSIPKKSPAPAK